MVSYVCNHIRIVVIVFVQDVRTWNEGMELVDVLIYVVLLFTPLVQCLLNGFYVPDSASFVEKSDILE